MWPSFFKDLRRSGCIAKKELKYISYKHKKISYLAKLNLLPKIHEKLENAPERPVISNCGTPTEKVAEYLGYHLKAVIQRNCSYIKDSGGFLEKIKNLGSLPENFILVSTNVVGFYPGIPHEEGLQAFKEALKIDVINKFLLTNSLRWLKMY